MLFSNRTMHSRSGLRALLLAYALLALLEGAWAQLPAPPELVPVRIRPDLDMSLCAELASGGTSSGTRLQLAKCDGNRHQEFFLVRSNADASGVGIYQIRPAHVGNANLAVAQESTADHAQIELQSSIPDDWQLFRISGSEIRTLRPGRCLDVPGSQAAAGVVLQQYACNAGRNQRWFLQAVSTRFHLIAKHSRKCVALAARTTDVTRQEACQVTTGQQWMLGPNWANEIGGYNTVVSWRSGRCLTASGDQVDLSLCEQGNAFDPPQPTDAQLWRLERQVDGFVMLRNKATGSCLDVAADSTADGAVVHLYACNASDNQRFWYGPWVKRPIHVYNLDALDSADAAIQAHVEKVNQIYGAYGVTLTYDRATDRTDLPSSWCGSVSGDPEGCFNWLGTQRSEKVAVIYRSGGGFTSGNANRIMLFKPQPANVFNCRSVPDVFVLAHEFGHFIGISHPGSGDNDRLADTRADAQGHNPPNDCLAIDQPTGINSARETVDTDNIMSYYRHLNPRITPMQAAVARAGIYSRRW